MSSRMRLSAMSVSWAAEANRLPSVVAWVSAALAERDFLPFEEPYRTSAQPAASVA
jgi:hypothetical protein